MISQGLMKECSGEVVDSLPHVVQPPQHQRDWGYEIVGRGRDPPPAPAPLS